MGVEGRMIGDSVPLYCTVHVHSVMGRHNNMDIALMC